MPALIPPRIYLQSAMAAGIASARRNASGAPRHPSTTAHSVLHACTRVRWEAIARRIWLAQTRQDVVETRQALTRPLQSHQAPLVPHGTPAITRQGHAVVSGRRVPLPQCLSVPYTGIRRQACRRLSHPAIHHVPAIRVHTGRSLSVPMACGIPFAISVHRTGHEVPLEGDAPGAGRAAERRIEGSMTTCTQHACCVSSQAAIVLLGGDRRPDADRSSDRCRQWGSDWCPGPEMSGAAP